MITKWFFSKHFATAGLCLLKAAAMQTRYANLGCCNTNQLVTVYYLDPVFYANGNWAHKLSDTTPYKPYDKIPTTDPTFYIWPPGSDTSINWNSLQQRQKIQWTQPATYDQSVNYTTGCFCKNLMTAIQISTAPDPSYRLAALPVKCSQVQS